MSSSDPGLHQRPSKLNLKPTERSETPKVKPGHSPKTAKNTSLGKKWLFLATVVASAVGLYNSPSIRKRLSSVSEDGFPKNSFAVCSQEGDKVYTVDAGNSRTECIVVDDKIIAGLGSLGTQSTRLFTPVKNSRLLNVI